MHDMHTCAQICICICDTGKLLQEYARTCSIRIQLHEYACICVSMCPHARMRIHYIAYDCIQMCDCARICMHMQAYL